MKKEIKIGAVYFENEILKVTYTNGYYPGHFMYEMDILCMRWIFQVMLVNILAAKNPLMKLLKKELLLII